MMGPRGTGVGSLPGTDIASAVRMLHDVTPDLVAFPELPARGLHAAMIGRGLAVAADLPFELDAHGWRLSDSEGVAARRARSLLAEDLDRVEEVLDGERIPLKIQVAGPWTLAAVVAVRSGEKVLGDHGARRDFAEALAHGVREHVDEVLRRFDPTELVVQIDEPSLPAVVGGSIRTASGLNRHAAPDLAELSGALATVALDGAVVHCCAPDVPVTLLAGAGFEAISFDLSLATPSEAWASAFESGVDLWPGEVTDRHRIDDFFRQLGFGSEEVGARLVVTPPCGLAGSTLSEARAALATAQQFATS